MTAMVMIGMDIIVMAITGMDTIGGVTITAIMIPGGIIGAAGIIGVVRTSPLKASLCGAMRFVVVAVRTTHPTLVHDISLR